MRERLENFEKKYYIVFRRMLRVYAGCNDSWNSYCQPHPHPRATSSGNSPPLWRVSLSPSLSLALLFFHSAPKPATRGLVHSSFFFHVVRPRARSKQASSPISIGEGTPLAFLLFQNWLRNRWKEEEEIYMVSCESGWRIERFFFFRFCCRWHGCAWIPKRYWR